MKSRKYPSTSSHYGEVAKEGYSYLNMGRYDVDMIFRSFEFPIECLLRVKSGVNLQQKPSFSS